MTSLLFRQYNLWVCTYSDNTSGKWLHGSAPKCNCGQFPGREGAHMDLTIHTVTPLEWHSLFGSPLTNRVPCSYPFESSSNHPCASKNHLCNEPQIAGNEACLEWTMNLVIVWSMWFSIDYSLRFYNKYWYWVYSTYIRELLKDAIYQQGSVEWWNA